MILSKFVVLDFSCLEYLGEEINFELIMVVGFGRHGKEITKAIARVFILSMGLQAVY